ncbi:hypothetical protein OWM07_04455 [Deferribacter thermophilus]|uniref:hypothetical protein n=1 Tax=Deferribacter thermophilus TaxID=53573 RepID=UPI003C174EF3
MTKKTNLDELFYELIESAEKSISKTLSEYSKIYILNLLKKLTYSNELLNNEILKEKAIAEIFMEAFHQNIFEKIRLLKLAGDFSLLLSGLYPDSIKNKLVSIDYYIKMGKSSYKELANTYGQYRSKLELMQLYLELKREFYKLVEILTEIADNINFINKDDLLYIKQNWEKTNIKKYKEILDKNKIIPI